jgi:penicillin-binding protein 2
VIFFVKRKLKSITPSLMADNTLKGVFYMKKRLYILNIIIFLLSAGLCTHLYFIMLGNKTVNVIGDNRYSYSVEAEKFRGNIYDRNGKPFLYRDEATALFIDPQYFRDSGKGMELAKQLNRDYSELMKKLMDKRPFIIITYDEIPEMEGITKLPIKGRYGIDSIAAHIIGYTDKDGAVGKAGIEKAYDYLLKDGGEITIKYSGNAQAGSIPGLGVDVTDNINETGGVKLTLDYDIQKITDEAADRLLPKGAVVVEDIATGEIVAMTSRPDFNPEKVEQYIESKNGELLNRCILAYPLGSIFKTVVAAYALENGANMDGEPYVCEGSISVDGIVFHCLKEEGHGELSLSQAFCKSCNPYFISLCLKMGGMEVILPLAKSLGFEESIPLFNGITSAKGSLIKKPNFILPSLSANTAIGQGEVLATPLQAADMMATIGSGGLRHRPYLVKSIINKSGKEIMLYKESEPARIISEETAKKLQVLLRRAVTEGSGRAADGKNVYAAGKTSSAEGVGDEVHGWFAGFFPYNNPKYAISVFAEDGKTGGGSCAPVFSAIAEAIVKIEQQGENINIY